MDPATTELLKQGILGITTVVFLGLFLLERKDHRTDNDKAAADKKVDLAVIASLQEARRLDAKETVDKIEKPLNLLATTTEFIANKLVIAKRGE